MWHRRQIAVVVTSLGVVGALSAGPAAAQTRDGADRTAEAGHRAAPGSGRGSMAAAGSRRRAPSFRVVRETVRPVVKDSPAPMTSPQPGELWVAETNDDGQLLLEHLSNGVWTSESLPVRSARAQLFSGGGRLVLVAGGTFYTREDERWVERPNPQVDDDAQLTMAVQTAAVGGDGTVYMHAETEQSSAPTTDQASYRLDGDTWTLLGASDGLRWGREVHVEEMKVLGRQVLLRWVSQTGVPVYMGTAVDRYDGTTWQTQYDLFDNTVDLHPYLTAWIARGVDDQIGFGGVEDKPFCVQYTAGVKKDCTSILAPEAAELRTDGSIVLGGDDGFRLRRKNGTEQVVGGSTAVKMADLQTEPGTARTWAVTTRADGKSVLQLLGE